MGPLDVSRPWETRAVVGSQRSCNASGGTCSTRTPVRSASSTSEADEETRRLLHRTIDAVRADLHNLKANTAIARLAELNNHLSTPPHHAS